MPGAKLRERYLSEREIEQSRIITADFGFDTITEAFTARENIRELEIPNIIILTTKTHGLRVRYIFGEIFKRDPHCPHVNGYKLEFHDSTPDDGLLFVEEERLLLEAVKTLFAKKYYIGIYSEEEDERLKIPDPTNKFQWRDENSEYYQKLLRIRRKFPEGPAYYPWIER
jgi:hypothetical protein